MIFYKCLEKYMPRKKEENLFVIIMLIYIMYMLYNINLFCIFPFADKCQKTTYYGV